MLLDKQNLFSDAQNITGTCYSLNHIYFGPNDVSYLPLRIQVVLDFAGLTSLNVDIETSDNVNFTNPVTLCSASLAVAKLKAGAIFPISYIPKGNLGYMRIKYTVTGTATAGKITAGIVNTSGISWHEA